MDSKNKNEVIKIIEQHIEKIFQEIWLPIENKIRSQIHDVDETLNNVNKKMTSYEKRYAKLRQEFRTVKDVSLVHREEDSTEIHRIRNDYSNLKKDILYEVKDSVKLAIELGTKAQELQAPLNDRIQDYENQIRLIATKAKESIKKETDLRIMEVLALQNKYQELIKLSDASLRRTDLLKNIEEPSKIIL
jgi:hypothetical protein